MPVVAAFLPSLRARPPRDGRYVGSTGSLPAPPPPSISGCAVPAAARTPSRRRRTEGAGGRDLELREPAEQPRQAARGLPDLADGGPQASEKAGRTRRGARAPSCFGAAGASA